MIFSIFRRYINRYNSENNSDMRTNGELRLLQEVLPDCATIFDVGANVGEWTELALDINPDLKIHCFEPSVATFRALQSRGIKGAVVLNHLGLGAYLGEKTLYVFADKAGTNSVYRREGLNNSQAQTEQIRMDTLDSYCQRKQIQHIDFLKLDVEGHELYVLNGALAMLNHGRIRRIQFEYGGTYIDAHILLKDIFDLLVPCGYLLYKIYPNALHPIERYDQCLENFQYSNWVAVRR